MNQLKKVFRMACLVVLIALALIGVGIIGGAPVPVNRRKENTIEIRTEIKETEENKDNIVFFDEQHRS